MELWQTIVAWWNRLSHDGKTATIIGGITIIIATLAIPGVIDHFSSAKPQEQAPLQSSTPQEPPKQEQPKQRDPNDNDVHPVKPHIRYVPLPNALPLDQGKTLVASVPEEGKEPETIELNGRKIPILTKQDVEMALKDKTLQGPTFVRVPGEMNFLVSIDAKGNVNGVMFVSGDKEGSSEAEGYIKGWRFKPFSKDGKDVDVDAVIQLQPASDSEFGQGKPSKKDR